MFLTDEELFTLTGYRQPSKQAAHLKAQRIPFHTNRAGHPRVAKAVLEGLRAKAPGNAPANKSTWSPSWAGSQQ